jgi:CRISPR system Cascade subunit CasA
LAKDKYNLVAHMGTSKSALVDTGDNKGIMGDIWTPVITEEQPKAWTVDPMGFPYSRVAWLLFGGSVKLPPSVNLQRGGGMLVLQAIPRGQGKTEGFHELLLALPNRMSTVEGLAEIRALTEDRIKVIDAVRKSILYPALVNFFTCGVSNLNEKRHLTWLDEFKKNVNSMFFPALWDDLKLDVDQRGAAFQQRLLTLSKSILNRAFASGAVASSVKRKSIAIAENIYEAGVFKMFESSQNKEK